ncbi:MAG: response regulator [Faecousia sp.]
MKALIVDDEQPVRSSIRLLADWQEYEIDEVFEAETVDQAITCIRRNSPQLVITDIRMPQHDGLELMQWLHQNKPQTQVVVISAYNEFDYAIRAMRLGAFDYLLKPIQPAQLDDVLRKVTQILQAQNVPKDFEETHPNASERIMLALYMEGDAELPVHSPVTQLLPIPAGLMILDLFCVSSDRNMEGVSKKQIFSALRELMEKDNRGLALLGVNDQNLLYLLLGGNVEEQMQTAEKALALLQEAFGVSPIYKLQCNCIWENDMFPKVAGQLIAAVHAEPLLEDGSSVPVCVPEFPEAFFDAAACGSLANAQRIIQPYIEQLRSFGCLSLEAFQSWWEALCECCNHYLQRSPDIKRTALVFLPGQTMLPILNEQMRLDLNQLAAFLQVQAQGLSNASHIDQLDSLDVCAQIRKDIQAHYSEPISLSTLAAKYYRNPSYLSRAFKERYGVGIMNFLAETRVEQAKILLKTTDYRISKIAQSVGYSDDKYFCRVFKKISGLSPADYRNL